MTRELDPTTYDVLDHVARYRLGVPEALAATPPFAGSSARRARRLMQALAEGDAPLLASAPLFGPRRYYYLTRAGEAAVAGPDGDEEAEKEGAARRKGGALSEVAKVRAYGALAFCCLSGRPRQRLTPREFREAFPEHHRAGMPTSYYVDREAKRLGFVRVDAGGEGRWDRVVEKVRRDLERHRASAAFRDSIAAGAFEMTLVAPTERKAGRLRPALEEEGRASGVPVGVHVVPELVELIAPPPRGRGGADSRDGYFRR